MIRVDLPKAKRSQKRKSRNSREQPKKRGLVFSIVVGSILVHVGALALFGIFVIAEYFEEPEAVFKVDRKVRIPAQTPEHRMNMAKHAAMAPKPVFSEKLVSIRPVDFALPDLPDLPIDQMLPLDPSELVSDQVAALSGTSGLGAGMGKALAGGSGNSDGGFSFFNLKDAARSVVIMIDVSASMFGRTGDFDYASKKLVRKGKDQEFQRIRDEAATLIDSLGINTRFGLIHWSGSARTWKEKLVPATDANKKEALDHLQARVDYNKAGPRGGRPGGTRHDYALEEVFKLQPETVFMLTDGNATRSLGRGSFEVIGEKELVDLIERAKKEKEEKDKKKKGKVPRIHTIYYVTGKDNKEEERMLRSIARKTKGGFTRIDARPKRRAREKEKR